MARFFQPGQTQYTEQFVPLDLGFIQGQMEQRQKVADVTKKEMGQLDANMGNLNALINMNIAGKDFNYKDYEVLKGIQQEYNNEVDRLITENPDFSDPNVVRRVQELNNKFQRDVAPTGRMGSLNENFTRGNELMKKASEVEGGAERPWILTDMLLEAKNYQEGKSNRINPNVSQGEVIDTNKAIESIAGGMKRVLEEEETKAYRSGEEYYTKWRESVKPERIGQVFDSGFKGSKLEQELNAIKRYYTDYENRPKEEVNAIANEYYNKWRENAIKKYEESTGKNAISGVPGASGRSKEKEEKTGEWNTLGTGRVAKASDGTEWVLSSGSQVTPIFKGSTVRLEGQGGATWLSVGDVYRVEEKSGVKYLASGKILKQKEDKSGNLLVNPNGTPILEETGTYDIRPIDDATAGDLEVSSGKLFPVGARDEIRGTINLKSGQSGQTIGANDGDEQMTGGQSGNETKKTEKKPDPNKKTYWE